MDNNLILVDTSYTSFYRFFATIRWLMISNPDVYKEHTSNPKYNWLEDKTFLEKYEKMYLDSIIKILGKRVYKKSKIVFCMDTPKEQVWRTTLLKCNYKGERADLSQKNDFKPIFKYTYNTIIPKILSENPHITKMRVEHLEGDDLIAIITKHFEKINPTQVIYIVSGDEDFLQLGRTNVKFINYKIKKPFELTKDEAKNKLHKKILLGDKSDCIDTIFPKKFNTKLKKELVESIEEFNKYLLDVNTSKEVQDNYKLNKQLIDFDNIPQKYQKQVLELYVSTII